MRKILNYFLFGAGGAFFGYLLFTYIGCISGSCPLQSSLVNSAVYGIFFGLVTAYFFNRAM